MREAFRHLIEGALTASCPTYFSVDGGFLSKLRIRRLSSATYREPGRFPGKQPKLFLWKRTMGQTAGTPNPTSRRADHAPERKSSFHSHRRVTVQKNDHEEDETGEWFHGDCVPSIPEIESSFSDNEDDSDCLDPSIPLARKKDNYPDRTSSSQVARRENGFAAPIATFRTITRPKKLARPTSIEEVRCINALMSNGERKAMELAHSWSPVRHSPNISLLTEKPLTIHRRPIAQSTDAVLSAKGYSKGVHIFEVHWPVKQRGTHPLVGVSLESLKLQGSGYVPLLGSDKFGWGWDLRRMTLIHDDTRLGKYPSEVRLRFCPDTFTLILDMDQGTVAFEAGGNYLGIAFTGLKGLHVHPAISAVWGSCEVELRYIGTCSGRLMTLQQICRNVIRSTLTPDRATSSCIDELPLPRMVKNYVACEIP